MNENYKEVDFKKYCLLCEHEKKEDWKDPCCECLEYGMNEGTAKPIHFKEKG